jgi:hypothetical protein
LVSGDLIDAALAVAPPALTETAADRRLRFRVIKGGVSTIDMTMLNLPCAC